MRSLYKTLDLAYEKSCKYFVMQHFVFDFAHGGFVSLPYKIFLFFMVKFVIILLHSFWFYS